MDTKKEYVQEFIKCKLDLEYFLSNYVKIPSSGIDTIKFKPYDCQKKYLNAVKDVWTKQNKTGVILLASRQCGKTQLTEAIIVWLMLFHSSYSVMIMSRELEQGRETISEIRKFFEELDDWLRPEFISPTHANRITLNNKSTVVLQASNQKSKSSNSSSKGRGKRPLFIWVDEAAFLPLDKHVASILPATSRSFVEAKKNKLPYGIVFSSTPNGRTGLGKGFYDYWMNAEYDPESSAFTPVKLHWSEIPVYDEKWYKEQCALLKHDLNRINQEYNLIFTGSELSLFSDDVIIDLQDVSKIKKPIKEINLHDGRISWWVTT